MKIKFLLTVSIIFLLISCNSNSLDEVTITDESSVAAKSISSNNSYIVMSSSNNLPKKLSQSIASANGTITSTISEIGMVVVNSDDPNFASKAAKIKGIQSVFPDFEIQGVDPKMEFVALDEDVANPPNSGDDDFFFDLQWGHDAVDAPEAWNAGYRGAGVRVFVLDEGIDAEHPDISPNLNTTLSASFVPDEDWNIRPGRFFNHGTHVAGTIAAADNGFGVIGIAPEAELVAVKVLSEFTGSGAFSWVINGIIYAANNEADVINMSLGGLAIRSDGSNTAQLKNAINRATTYAYQKGATVVVAAGNDGLDLDHLGEYFPGASSLVVLPADAPNVISISATAPFGWALDPENEFLDNPTYYTNFGQSAINFAAPGGTVEYPGEEFCQVAGLVRPCWVFDLVFSTSSEGWSWAQGTSMAAPHAAGVAALIIGKNGGSMKPAQVIAAMKRSADDLGKSGKDDYYGNGRVNAYRAVTE
jgi:subtilisin family serine protease